MVIDPYDVNGICAIRAATRTTSAIVVEHVRAQGKRLLTSAGFPQTPLEPSLHCVILAP
jgi:hypothetical protein